MTKMNKSIIGRKTAAALLLGATATLAGCGSIPTNRTLYSEHQPVVSRTNYVFDVMTSSAGIPISEQRRLSGWWEAMELSYGDKVSVDFSKIGPAARDDLVSLADKQGILLADAAPVTEGEAGPGVARVVVTRSTASVPGCPDWGDKTDFNPNNATSKGYGCAINGNLAAMVANPEDLLTGQTGSGETVVMSSTKAIETYRNKAPTGEGDLKSVSSSSGGGGSSN
ncbi:hypothetical protein GCM10010990_02120 [Croceicoccus mobilis]|uniref:Pilus assembly protein CpaD n=2 Tax=Croceicoccus mobilis TaxID=1703339 RepID=A0A917DQA6_9SPHN|nr:hypothetical protein GCM10010990_02120 [Croceicoccus mobilis]